VFLSKVDFWESVELVAVCRILKSRVLPLENESYVSRPEEEARIDIGVASPEYTVVIGPPGCGKSSVVLRVASRHRGVTLVNVGKESDNATARILKAYGICERNYDVSSPNDLVRLLKKAAAWRATYELWRSRLFGRSELGKGANKWVPTIIVEMDGSSSSEAVADVACQLKRLASDAKAACVFLVLSDANALFSLPVDWDRQDIVWIGDLSEAQAREWMERRNFAATEAEKKLVFDQLGTRAALLAKLMHRVETNKTPSVEVFVKERVKMAKVEIEDLLDLPFQPGDAKRIDFKQIMAELLVSPGGVSAKSASFTGATRVPSMCCEYFRRHRVFSFYSPEQSYVFYSRAHLSAARELQAEAKKTEHW
jgi:nucleotide-binding universal stress UspA family protein